MSQELVLRDLAVVFSGSLIVALAFHRLRLPALPGFIVAGALLGPNGLRLVSDVHRVESLAGVGVIFLLYSVEIEFSLSRMRQVGRQVLGADLMRGETDLPTPDPLLELEPRDVVTVELRAARQLLTGNHGAAQLAG